MATHIRLPEAVCANEQNKEVSPREISGRLSKRLTRPVASRYRSTRRQYTMRFSAPFLTRSMLWA